MGQSTPTTAKSGAPHKYVPFLVLLPFLVLPSIILFVFGETTWSLITLAFLIPVLFILLMGMLSPRFLPTPNLWEVQNHLTENERRQWKRMGAKYGVMVGCFASLFGPILSSIIHSHQDGETHHAGFIACGVLLLIMIALILRIRKASIRFALTTEYAKEKGWTTI